MNSGSILLQMSSARCTAVRLTYWHLIYDAEGYDRFPLPESKSEWLMRGCARAIEGTTAREQYFTLVSRWVGTMYVGPRKAPATFQPKVKRSIKKADDKNTSAQQSASLTSKTPIRTYRFPVSEKKKRTRAANHCATWAAVTAVHGGKCAMVYYCVHSW